MEGSHEFLLIDDFSGRHGQWVKTNSFETIDDGKLFAPGNLRGTQVCMLFLPIVSIPKPLLLLYYRRTVAQRVV